MVDRHFGVKDRLWAWGIFQRRNNKENEPGNAGYEESRLERTHPDIAECKSAANQRAAEKPNYYRAVPLPEIDRLELGVIIFFEKLAFGEQVFKLKVCKRVCVRLHQCYIDPNKYATRDKPGQN